MDHSDEKTSNKDEEPAPGSDVPVPATSPGDIPPASPTTLTSREDTVQETLEERQEQTLPEEPAVHMAEDKSPRSSLDPPAQDQVPSPSDSGERTPTGMQELASPEQLDDSPLPPVETVIAEVVQVDLQDTSSTDSTHSVPDSAVGLDSPLPPNSTAPSSTRTSLTDTPPAASSSSSSASKPVGILRSATLPRSASSTSMSAVTFAPLPPTEPRRRASHMQLGVAARSRMLRARRMRFVDPETGEAYIQVVDPAPAEPLQGVHYVYPGEDAAADGDPYAAARRQPRSPYATGNGGLWAHGQPAPHDDEGAPEADAFVAIGKILKGGAKALWRRVSKSQRPRARGAAAPPPEAAPVEEEDEPRRPAVRRSASAPAGLNGAHETEDEEDAAGEDDGALRIEFREPRHCFERAAPPAPPLVPTSILRPATPAAPAPAPASVPEGSPPRDGEVGRVWEEAVDADITARFEAVARAERERERGKARLVAKLARVGRRKESRERLKETL